MKITIIVGMRFGKLALNLLKYIIKNDIRKRRKHYPPHLFDEFINVPYIPVNGSGSKGASSLETTITLPFFLRSGTKVLFNR